MTITVSAAMTSQIIFRSQIAGGLPNEIIATVRPHANISGTTPNNAISAPITITPVIEGGVPNVINTQIMVWNTFNAISYGVTSTIVATVPFGCTATGGQFNTLSGHIKPRMIVSGFVVPFGQIAAPIIISGSAISALPDLINATINVAATIRAAQPVSGAASAVIKFGHNIQAAATLPQGTMVAKINFARRIVGQFAVQATVSAPIIISGLPSNRAQSFTSPGQPVSTAYSLGQIAVPIVFGCNITVHNTISSSIVGSANSPIIFTSSISATTKATGAISSQIIIIPQIGNSGLQVAKANPYTVLARSRYGVEVVKANPVVVLGNGPIAGGNELITKAVAYAVIVPSGGNTVSTSSNYGYTAIFFQ